MTTLKGSTDIRLLVNNEQDLYTPLSPESEFRQEVKDYIRKKQPAQITTIISDCVSSAHLL